jgi:hypothetical protein
VFLASVRTSLYQWVLKKTKDKIQSILHDELFCNEEFHNGVGDLLGSHINKKLACIHAIGRMVATKMRWIFEDSGREVSMFLMFTITLICPSWMQTFLVGCALVDLASMW